MPKPRTLESILFSPLSTDLTGVAARIDNLMYKRDASSQYTEDSLARLKAYGLELGKKHPNFDNEDRERLDKALHALGEGYGKGFDDLWSYMHMACVLGDKRRFMSALTLIDLDLLDPNEIGVDGSTLVHTIATHASARPFLEDAKMLWPGMAGRSDFKKMGEGYINVNDRIKLLVERGANLDVSIDGLRSTLKHALRERGLSLEEIKQELDNRGLAIDERWRHLRRPGASRRSSNTPEERREVIFRTLKMHGSPLLGTLLHKAKSHSKEAAMLALIKNGADLDLPIRREELDETEIPVYPLHAAAYLHTKKIVQAFIAEKANLRIKDGNGNTALHWAVLNEEHADVVQPLLDATENALLHMENKQKALPLHYAVSKPGNLDVIKTLLRAGASEDIMAQTSWGETALHIAARQPRNLAVIKELLAQGADSGIQLKMMRGHDFEGGSNTLMSGTALHHAARFAKDADIAAELISAFQSFAFRTFKSQEHDDDAAAEAADRETRDWVNAESSDGDTALHFAVSSDNPALVKALIDAGAEVNVRNRWPGEELLLTAAAKNNHRIVDMLLRAGANVADHPLVLHYGAKSTNPKVVTTLLENGGANFLHARTMGGYTPLHFAAEIPNNAATVKVLLDAGAIDDINIKTNADYGSETALQMAAKIPGNHEVVKLLLEARASDEINAQNNDGETALQMAVQKPDNLETIKLLLNAGADVHLKIDNQFPILHLAAEHAREPGVIDALILAKADIRAKTKDGATVLHFAATSEHPDVVQTVLDKGAKAFINTPTNNGFMPLHAAALESSNPETIACLLKAGADPQATFEGSNALHFAAGAYFDSPDIIKALVEAGIDINIKAGAYSPEDDDDGDSEIAEYSELSPLQIAVNKENHGAAVALLELGADATVLNNRNGTLLHMHLSGHTGGGEFTEELIDHGVDATARDQDGNTALHVYLQSDWPKRDIVYLLLKNGVDVNERNNENDTVLHIAARSKRLDMAPELVDALLENGADVRQLSGRNMSVLLEALTAIATASADEDPEGLALNKVPAMIRFIEKDVSVNDIDAVGNTALHIALQHHYLHDIIEPLLHRKAKVFLANHNGVTPVDLAERLKQESLNHSLNNLRDNDKTINVEIADSVIAAGQEQREMIEDEDISVNLKHKD